MGSQAAEAGCYGRSSSQVSVYGELIETGGDAKK